MFGRKFSDKENELNDSSEWGVYKDVVMLEEYEGFEGEIIVHVHVHRSNKFQIFNGMYTATYEPYLMVVHRPTDEPKEDEYFTWRNLTQAEEDLQIEIFLQRHKLKTVEGEYL